MTQTLFYTRPEVADMLRITTRTLDRIVATGDLIGFRSGGRRLLFTQEAIDRYVHKQTQKGAR